jgi:Na+/proline symporter
MTAAQIIVLTAILLPAILYLSLAVRENRRGLTIDTFYPLSRFLPGGEYGRSTAAAGVSLATVVLALVNLTPVMGLGLLVTIASYAASFVLLYFAAPTILRANKGNATLQSFLGSFYDSSAVRNTALVFSLIGYGSIFSMELIVGVTVLDPIFPNSALTAATLFLLFIMTYSAIGGFRAIVATEQWQVRAVLLAVASLAVFAVILWSRSSDQTGAAAVSDTLTSWNAGWAFCLGIIVMNLPAPISDAATWQRLCATRSEVDAKSGLRHAIVLFALIWGTLIVAGTFTANVASRAGGFDPASNTLMNYIIGSLAAGDALTLAILFAFTLGLFAALITTADSLLLICAQLVSLDLLRVQQKGRSERDQVKSARMTLGIIGLASFSLFVLFRYLKLDVVSLVFAIYGAQLALFPATAAALLRGNSSGWRPSAAAAIVSIGGGFLTAWGSALYGRFGGDATWMYNAPAVGLAASVILLLAHLSFPSRSIHGGDDASH